MTHWYELTVMVRTDEAKGEDAFEAAVDRVANRLDAKVMHRVAEVREEEVPIPLRDKVTFHPEGDPEGEGEDG